MGKTSATATNERPALVVSLEKTATLREMGAPYNPRVISDHDLSSLRRSLREFGAVEPIIVNTRSNRVVGGHQRIRAAELEGIETLPVVHVDLDDQKERTLNLALNRISGDWNRQMLADMIRDLDSAGADLEGTGFSADEIEKLVLVDVEEAARETAPRETFTEILGERQDFVLLVFRTEMDWTAAQSLFGIETTTDHRSNGKPWSKGLGRVLDGAKALDHLRRALGVETPE